MTMISLCNNCRVGKFSVHPKNWNTQKAKVSSAWRVTYWFYDDNIPDKKQVRFQGMNDATELKDRQFITKILMEDELKSLRDGFNPITEKYENIDKSIPTERTPFILALDFAISKVDCSKNHMDNLESNLSYIKKAIYALRIEHEPIGSVKLKHTRLILDWLSKNKKNWSDNQFNVFRKALSRFFTVLEDYELVIANFAQKIQKKQLPEKMRQILSDDEAKKVYDLLFKNHYTFWRFMMIFFQSGSRISELMRLKVKDVDLINQEFKITVYKGKQSKEDLRAITQEVLPYWQRLMLQSISPEDYVFSAGLLPGKLSINPKQITRRWYVHIKKPGISSADFYSLKHLFLDGVAATEGLEAAQKAAGHTTPNTTRIYTVKQKRRDLEKNKQLKISFVNKDIV